jgi:hypothetical protein
MHIMTTHAVRPYRQLGSLFTDWRNSIESALTGGASDSAPSINIPLSLTTPQNTPPAKTTAAVKPMMIFGYPATTVAIGVVGALVLYKALRR